MLTILAWAAVASGIGLAVFAIIVAATKRPKRRAYLPSLMLLQGIGTTLAFIPLALHWPPIAGLITNLIALGLLLYGVVLASVKSASIRKK